MSCSDPKGCDIIGESKEIQRLEANMRKTEDLFDEAVSLPVEKRTLLVDKLLQSLNPTQSEIDKLWAEEAERRVEEITHRSVKTIPGEEVFSRIRERLGS
jgi:putative addiction module component (TIGR02574 family)